MAMMAMAADGMVDGAGVAGASIRGWLRLEGAVAFVVGLALFGWLGGPWLLVIPLLLLPDVSMIGYLRGPRLGALTYNVVHTWAPGLALLAAGLVADARVLAIAGAILVAHVGMDRAAGYGLKLPTSFHDTHLGHIGKDRDQS
jgi:hypothetical protein